MFEFVEEALDEVPIAVEERAESWDALAVRHGFDAGPCSARCQGGAHGVAVVGAIGKQDAAFAEAIEHVSGRSAVVRLSFSQLEGDG